MLNFSYPLKVWAGPFGSGRSRLPELVDSRHTKAVKLLTLHTGRLYLSGDIPVKA